MTDGSKAREPLGVYLYFVAVLFAVGFLFAISAVPSDSADLFPDPGPEELVRVVQQVWASSLQGMERLP